MNMKYLLSVLVGLFVHICAGQFSSEVWHDGFLVTSKNDTLRGKIKYDMESNSVQFYNDQFVRTFSSFQLVYFNIFDEVLDSYRQFYSIPYRLQTDYETPIIFELLYEGKLSLLSREIVVQEAVPAGAGVYTGSIVRDRLSQAFFFVDKKGKLTNYNGKKSALFSIMQDKSSKVKSFIKQNKLRANTTRDLVRITAFYNSI